MKKTSTTKIIRYLAHRIAILGWIMCLPVFIQAQTIKLNHSEVPIETVLKSITEQTGYKFVYAGSVIDTKQKVSININTGNISEVLDALFKDTNIAYKIANKQVALSLREEKTTPSNAPGGLRKITGKVIAQDGHPLVGVTVYIEGTSTGTVTDIDGNYSLNVKDDPELKLTFRYLGMESTTVTVGPRTRIDITMISDNVTMEQVIVTGYQTISQERSAGSYSIITGAEIQDRAIAKGSILESLEGTAAGLNINLGSEGDKFLVRGITSINSNRSPLFIVDGVSVPAAMIESMLNGNDVKSVTVLKDATAASIWGAQAANGVVVITTKSGSYSEKVKISYNGSYTFKGKPDYSYQDRMNSSMFIKSATEIFDPIGYPWETVSTDILNSVLPHEIPLYQYHLGQITEAEKDAELQRLSNLNGRKDYEKYMMTNAWLTNHSVSLSGGNNNHTFYVSLGYQGQQGSYKDRVDEYRINARENINITNWLKLDLTLNASYGNEKSHLTQFTIDDDPGATGLTNLPYAVFYDEKGNELSFTRYLLNESIRKNAEELTGINLDYYPLQDFKNTTQESVSKNIRANAGITINIIDGLKYEGRFSYYTSHGNREIYTPSDAYNVRLDRVYATNKQGTTYLPSTGGYFQVNNTDEQAYTIRNQFSYDNIFSDRHQITALLGSEVNQNKTASHTSTMRGYDKQTMQAIFYDDYIISVTGVNNTVLEKLGNNRNYFDSERYVQGETTYRFVSFYANAAYTLDQRFSLNGSIRVDQSNLFGSDPSIQFKPIWSLGAVWNISREKFMQTTTWIDELNIRASYGFSGNSPSPGQGGPYDIISATSDPSYSEFGLGYVISTPANDKLTWEKTRTWNFGFSFGILGNRLFGSLDAYSKKTTDLLSDSPIDPSTGYTSVLQNIGEMTNKGFEISLNSRNISNQNFIWDTDFVLSYNKNKIVDMYFPAPDKPSGRVNEEYVEGHPAGALFAYKWAGLDPSDGAPRVYNSKDSIVRSSEEIDNVSAVIYKGTTVPKWSGSFTNTIRSRNIELSFMFIANLGHKMRNDTYTQDGYRLLSNIHKDFDKRWRKPGDEKFTNIPSYYSKDESPNRSGGTSLLRYSDIGILDASYIKLRELSIGYYLPRKICQSLSTESIKLRIQANNLWTIAFNKEGIDPESFSLRYGSRGERYNPSISASMSIDF